MAVSTILLLAGCGGNNIVANPTPTPPVGILSVVVTPSNPSVNLVNHQQFSASINGVPSTAVTWSISGTGCTGSTCGDISPTGLYTAPWCAPSPALVTVRATANADATKFGATVITPVVQMPTLGAGQYAFLFQGTDKDGLMQSAGAFILDNAGNVTSGVEDIARLSAVNTSVTFTGTYSLPCYNRGTITFNNSLGQTQTFAFGVDPSGQDVRFIAMDNTLTIRGSGVATRQDPATFVNGLNGEYAFGFAGTRDLSKPPGRVASIGRFTASAGTISSGKMDINTDGVTQPNLDFTGTYTGASVNLGRGTAVMTETASGKTSNMSYYVVSSNKSYWVSTDLPGVRGSMFSGQSMEQSGGPFTNLSLNQTAVFALTGKTPGTGTGAEVAMGILKPDGAGNLGGGPMDENLDSTLSAYNTLSGTYTVDLSGNGRGTMHIVMSPTVSRDLTFYIATPNKLVLLDGTATIPGPLAGMGFMETQQGAPFSLATLKGPYYMGAMGMSTPFVPVNCGVFIADGLGNAAGMGDQSDMFLNHPNQGLFSGAYYMTTPGKGLTDVTPTGNVVFYVVSPAKAWMFEMRNTQHQPVVSFIEQ